ncbi:MAG: N-acetylmuramoyl-L-alanine amidase [Bradyrhizobium sp.]|nr:N-acetylmuramoyl-L-alanine amidase [Bradyrhizobium sp.]
MALLAAALGCAAALLCLRSPDLHAEDGAERATGTPSLPIASDARLAGDSKQTRFILDLDRSVPFRAFALAHPHRVVVDVPQVNFQLAAGTGATGRGLITAFRYGLVMPGGSRLVFDLAGPARIAKAYALDAANGQPPRLVLELEAVDESDFDVSLAVVGKPDAHPGPAATAISVTEPTPVEDSAPAPKLTLAPDKRPVLVIDPGHGGIDNGTQASGETEKNLVLNFSTALRDRIEKTGKYRVIMTRADDTFVPLGERVKIARGQAAALFVSIHADALPHGEGDAQGATIYTLSERASDAEAERLAESENRADAIGGVNLTDEPAEVADILIDLAQRETRMFSNRFARTLEREMKTSVRKHKHPLKSAGFKVLKAPDVPSVLIELGYVSNKADLEHLVSEEWRSKTVGSVAQAIDAFFAKRMVTAGSAD